MFRKPCRHGEKGFTLIELLIVIAVLGVLAAVVVPAVTQFLGGAHLGAASAEQANVITAATSYLAATGDFPSDSDDLMTATGGTEGDFLSETPKYGVYTFSATTGEVISVTPTTLATDNGLSWSGGQWTR